MANYLVPKTIYDLLGMHFYIPYYQREYRWTKLITTDGLYPIQQSPEGIDIEDRIVAGVKLIETLTML